MTTHHALRLHSNHVDKVIHEVTALRADRVELLEDLRECGPL